MRTIILVLSLIPFFCFSQTNNKVFIKLTDANGKQINGESKDIHYKDWIYTTFINSSGNNNTLLSFTMDVSGASAVLKKAMLTSLTLLNGEVNVTAGNKNTVSPEILYKIKMEKIKVLNCSETTGSNNSMQTAVTLQATRIGWIYYTTSNTGVQTESKRYGWDVELNKEWDMGEKPIRMIKARDRLVDKIQL